MAGTKGRRGGYRPNAGRKPKDGAPRRYITVTLLRDVVEGVPPGVNRCEFISNALADWLRRNDTEKG